MPEVTGTPTATFINNNGVTETALVRNPQIQATGDAINGIGNGNVYGTDPNALASQWRSNGIPPGAEASYDFVTVSAQFSEPAPSKDWRVRLSCDFIYNGNQVLAPLANTAGMIFPYLPQITMSHSANYSQMDITHNNYPFFAYKNSQVDEINITGKFTVQNKAEADYWLAAVHFLRTVTKMFFGQGEYLGNPPPICVLNGYGDFVYKDVSCIVKNFTVTMPNDVDYIEANAGGGDTAGTNVSYVPVSSEISVTVQPVYSREKIKSFNLMEFAQGNLVLGSDGKGFI
jgi:hypothetical protein